MLYLTIIICTLLVCATVIAWRYFDGYTSIESAYDTQLDDISIIISRAKERHNLYMDEDSDKKFRYKHTDEELADIFDAIYRISTRGYKPDNE